MSEQNQINPGFKKPEPVVQASSAGNKQPLTMSGNCQPSAPAPTWTRYIDSRLKQFCVR